LAKLKHAFDKWNSNIYLILDDEQRAEAEKLLSGAFHEINQKTKLINLDQMEELFNLKKKYFDYERQIGICRPSVTFVQELTIRQDFI
ncbi:MAG: hypothetical protein QXT39_06680, partial [Conexivisphaerales archaeon]